MKFSYSLMMIPLLWALSLTTMYANEGKPPVVPEVKIWTSTPNEYNAPLPRTVTILIDDDDAIREVAKTLQVQLLKQWGITGPISVIGDSPVDQPFISLTLTTLEKRHDEAYQLSSNGRSVQISANTPIGLRWGVSTLMQLIDKCPTLPAGVIIDWPDVSARGFMIDAGRKYIPLSFLRYYVDLMAYYKMNELQVHLNDNGFVEFFDNDWDKTYSAFRLESDLFPELTAKDGSYTKQEFIDLQKYALSRGVTIIPEIDVPAHALAFTHYRPSLGTEKYGMDHLDLHNPEVYTFVDSLLAEYIGGEEPVFIGRDVHIGTDEYSSEELEPFRAFADRYIRYVKSFGKRPRIWGSLRKLHGETPVDVDSVIINAWNANWSHPLVMAQKGAGIINTFDHWLYIVPGAKYYHDFLDTKMLYNQWQPRQVNAKEAFSDDDPALYGAMFAVWNDHVGNGITVYDIHQRAMPALATLATKMWNEHPRLPYEDFAREVNERPELPMNKMLGRWGDERIAAFNQQQQERSYHLSGQDTYCVGPMPLGYDYTVAFTIKTDSDQLENAILFQDGDAQVLVNVNGSGLMGFSREGKTFIFGNDQTPHLRLQPDQTYRITISGTKNSTSLTINDQEPFVLMPQEVKSKLKPNGHYSYMYIQPTLYFPMVQVGDAHNGFKGEVSQLHVSQTPRSIF